MIGGPTNVVPLRLPEPRAGGGAAVLGCAVTGIDPALAARSGRGHPK